MKSKVTITLDYEIWKKFRILAIQKNKSASKMIEEFIRSRLKSKKK